MTFVPEEIPADDLISLETSNFTKFLISKDGKLDVFLNFTNQNEDAFIKAALAKLSTKVNVDFNFVNSEKEADLIIGFKGPIYSLLQTVIGVAVPFPEENKWKIYLNDQILLRNYEQLYETTLHEMGHVLGLEHPFDNNDGDFFRSTNPYASAYPEETVMSYREPATGVYPQDFTNNDLRALINIWGARVTPQQKNIVTN